jgi:hypothetical protein
MSDLEKKVRTKKTLLSYGIINTPDGDLLLQDLDRAFGFHYPAFLPGADGTLDPIRAAVRDGQRQVLLHIRAMALKAYEETTGTSKKN